MNQKHCTVAIVGSGPAGLAAATQLHRRGIADVLVIERDKEPGGVPRHCDHYPFGMTEFWSMLKGPAYVSRLLKDAETHRVTILSATSVTALQESGRLLLSDENGQSLLQADRVLICTGTRERSRAQRLLSGHRPMGVITTGALQSLVFLKHLKPFSRPVILGTELVSMSAIMTCRHLGIQPLAMLEENGRVTVPELMRIYPYLRRIPLHLGVSNLRIQGDARVESLHFVDADGHDQALTTDGVILSGQFQPEAELIKRSHLYIDHASGGPVVDQFYRCSDPAYFSAGNVLRPVENASWCWREGVAAANCIADDLLKQSLPTDRQAVTLSVQNGSIKLAVPQRICPVDGRLADSASSMQRLQLRLNQAEQGMLTAECDGKVIWQNRLSSLPERRILKPMKPLIDQISREPHTRVINLSLR